MTLHHIKQLTQGRLQSLHNAQGGAIIMLVLAGFLILILTSLMMFDAGRATTDKMQVQTAADSAAYSQAVVKARTMNMVSYANTAKRMFYAYIFVYFAGWEALIASWVKYASRCFRIFPDLKACVRWGVGLSQIIVQIIKFILQDLSTMAGRSSDEVKNLDNYQKYMVKITPWWGYAENILRGVYNGATITASWPPPPGTLTKFIDKVSDFIEKLRKRAQQIDSIIGTSLASKLNFNNPFSTNRDRMPLERRSGVKHHAGYCGEFILSPEHLIAAGDHYFSSKSGFGGISKDGQTLGMFAGANLVMSLVNCTLASFFLGDHVLDYRIDNGVFANGPDQNQWNQSTSNITMAYKAGGHRVASRQNYKKLLPGVDHDENAAYEANGYWSLARSEFVYADKYSRGENGSGNFLSQLGSLASKLAAGPLSRALVGDPNMWYPKWTAKLRPLHLPDEKWGPNSNTNRSGTPIGLETVFVDTFPYLAISGLISGLFDSGFSMGEAINDAAFFYLAASGFDANKLEGLTQ